MLEVSLSDKADGGHVRVCRQLRVQVFKATRGGVQDVAVKVLNIQTPSAKERAAFEKARTRMLAL